jgi:hypothetical protein
LVNGSENCRIAGHCCYESYFGIFSFLVCRTFWSMPRRSNELLTSLEDADVCLKSVCTLTLLSKISLQ